MTYGFECVDILKSLLTRNQNYVVTLLCSCELLVLVGSTGPHEVGCGYSVVALVGSTGGAQRCSCELLG
jgi:hypothetical protein